MRTGRQYIQSSFYRFLSIITLLAFSGCSDDKTELLILPPPTPAIDISGVWAGTWSGTDSIYGQVTGNWEAEVTQSDRTFRGSGTLTGDVDCMDGVAEGSVDENNEVSGTLSRYPCPQNKWTMTALNLLERTTSGVWTKPETGGSGTFTGLQIATPGGPRISFLNPSGGLPGTIVTIVGTGFGPAEADTRLDFNATPADGFLSFGPGKLVARVPYGATTGHTYLTTPKGTAIGPRSFSVKASFPASIVNNTLTVGTLPEGVAISPDGRKAYVANKGSGTVSMINTATNQVITTTNIDPVVPVPVQGVVASPEGKRVYVAGGPAGISVLDAATLIVLDTIFVNAGGGAQMNPQGLAMSPDGQLLYVSDNHDEGAVAVLDIASRTVIASLSLGPGSMPLGIAVSPDGTRAYIAFSGSNEIQAFDPFSNSVTDSFSSGSQPVGVAVTPDGKKVYVSNELGNSVSVYDIVTGQITTKPAGIAPAGIAISPDGSRVFIANKGNNTVSVMSTASDQFLGAPVPVGEGPVGIAISPDGKRAYVTNSGGNSVSELGGTNTLTIAKSGTGIGRVNSSPEGISCGDTCQALYDNGTSVTLTATPDGGSYFTGWSDNCSGGAVFMNANTTCTATFSTYYSSGSGGGGGSGSGSGSGGNGGDTYYYGGCYIATAAYGSTVDPRAMVLSTFHDTYFTTSRLGKAVTEIYHNYAPFLGDLVSRHPSAQFAVRTALAPVVYAIQHPVTALFAVVLFAAAASVARKRWITRKKRIFGDKQMEGVL